MALTIEQIQANITAKGDAREIINQIADYIEANPGGGSGGGVESVTGDLTGGTATEPTIDVASMTEADELDGSELVPIIQGTKKQTTSQDIADLATTPPLADVLTSGSNVDADIIITAESTHKIELVAGNAPLLTLNPNQSWKVGSEGDGFIEQHFPAEQFGSGTLMRIGTGGGKIIIGDCGSAGNRNTLTLNDGSGILSFFSGQIDSGVEYLNVQSSKVVFPTFEYADNAAAIAGGLAVNTVYRVTGTGQLNQVFAIGVLDPVANFTATPASSSQINLNWDDVADATNYIVLAGLRDDYLDAVEVYSGATSSFNHTGLNANTHYYYVVKAQAPGYLDTAFVLADATTNA